MKATRVVGQLAVAVLSLSPSASALAWPQWLPALDSLVARDNTASASATQTASATSTASEAAAASTTDAASSTNLNTAGITSANSASATGSGSGSTSNAATTSHTTYDAESPAGSITMLTPTTTSGVTQLYRIGEYVTWGWNYTGLSATPTAIDVLVSCSTASETFTLTTNMTFTTPGSFTWDTGAYQSAAVQNPLPVAMYTLVIYEADSSVSATAEAGYLAAFTGFNFGLYTGRPYTPLASGWVCATCSGAMSDMERRGVGVVVIMSICTVLSFTWFVTGFGAFV